MNNKSLVLLVGMFNSTLSWAALNEGTPPMPSFAEKQGALSYTFFNLSPSACNLTPQGASGNPAAYSSWGVSNGWMNSGTYQAPGFFNPNGVPFVIGNNANYTYYIAKSGTSNYFTSSYVFYDWSDSPLLPDSPPSGQMKSGQNYSGVSYSAAVNNLAWNTPAMGDSFYINCQYFSPATGSISVPMAIASLASSQNALVSANTGFYVTNPGDGYQYLSTNYWYPAYPGWFGNSDINPIAEGNPSDPSQPCYGGVSPAFYSCSYPNNYGAQCLNNPQDYTNPDSSSSTWPSNPNPCGAGFTSSSAQVGSQSFNWNSSNTSTVGGLWSGINYQGQSSFSAANPYPAVLNVNTPMLPINLSAYVASNSNNPAQLYPSVNWTPIMGGHFTYAIGDPFIISSFAAKSLAYLATSPTQLNNATDLASLSYTLTSSTNPVFTNGSTANEYIQWLMGSQSSSQNYTGAAQLAANAFQTTYNAALNNTKTTESIWGTVFSYLADVAIIGLSDAIKDLPGGHIASAVVGGVTETTTGILVDQANSAIESAYTTTSNPTQPQSVNAPAVVNPTYSSSNLLGLFLSNSGVQYAINSTMKWTDNNPSPLLSNYSINTNNSCDNTLQLEANLLEGICSGTNNASPPSGPNPPSSSTWSYSNVYPGASATLSTNQLSIWTAILTGSNIQVNGDGWIILGDSSDGNAPFQPPFQLYSPNVPSYLPSGSTNPAIAISFNPMNFILTAQSISWNPPSSSSSKNVCSEGSSAVSGSNPVACEYSFNSNSSASAPTLDYMKCVNDPQATGGIIATLSDTSTTISSSNVVLACACIPAYIGGPSAPSDSQVTFVTGASSNNPKLTCTNQGG